MFDFGSPWDYCLRVEARRFGGRKPGMTKAKRTGVAGLVAVAMGFHRMTPAELLCAANIAAADGYPGVAAVAMAEMRARLEAAK